MNPVLLDNFFFEKILNLKSFDNLYFWTFIFKFCFNLLINFIIIRFIYYKSTSKKHYLFSYILISIVVFFLCFMLSNVTIELGFAIGLFAIFGIIKYRTRQIPIKEMTYLFVIIGLSVVNAIENTKITIAEILFVNVVVLIFVWILERLWLVKYGVSKKIVYEKIENIRKENYNLLIADLEERTGLKIKKVEVKNINFLRDIAYLEVFYEEESNTLKEEE